MLVWGLVLSNFIAVIADSLPNNKVQIPKVTWLFMMLLLFENLHVYAHCDVFKILHNQLTLQF